MIERLIAVSLQQRWLVLLLALGAVAFGAWNFQRLPIDAVPDITNVQVQINTARARLFAAGNRAAHHLPVETAMGGLPKLDYTRSLSRYGLSQVTVVFKDGTDIYFARQLVNERIQQVKDQLPAGVEVAMGPISTGLGEIFMYTVEAKAGARRRRTAADYSPTDLRDDAGLDHQAAAAQRARASIEVNTIGGFERQFHVLPDPGAADRPTASAFRDVMTALAANNANVGAGYIERNGEQYLVRTPGQVGDIDEIRDDRRRHRATACRSASATSPTSRIGTRAAHRRGDARTARKPCSAPPCMLIGENSRTVAQRVAAQAGGDRAIAARRASWRGRVYDRTALVDATIATVEKNLLEGALLVIVVLFLLLGNIRAALVTALRHSAVDADHRHRHGREPGQRQPDEPRRASTSASSSTARSSSSRTACALLAEEQHARGRLLTPRRAASRRSSRGARR